MTIVEDNGVEDNSSNPTSSTTVVKASEIFHDPDIKDVFAKFKPLLPSLPLTRSDTIRRLPEANELEDLGEISDAARLFAYEDSKRRGIDKSKIKKVEKSGSVRGAAKSSKLKKTTFSEVQSQINGLQMDNTQERLTLWSFTEDYFRCPSTEDVRQFLQEFDSDGEHNLSEDVAFKMPRENGRNYKEVWMEEDAKLKAKAEMDRTEAKLRKLMQRGISNGSSSLTSKNVITTIINPLDDEDEVCHVCCEGESEMLACQGNEILFCEKCDVPVHQACYGVKEIPPGPWLCNPCHNGIEKPKCVLCPKVGGAYKPVKDFQAGSSDEQHWAHLFCSQWIPETYIRDHDRMEPIENVENVSKERLRLICVLCKRKEGACIQCSHGHCAVSFHPLCAKEAGYRMEVSSLSTNLEEVDMKAYCLKHSRLRPRVRPSPMDTPVSIDGSPCSASLNVVSPMSPQTADNNAVAERNGLNPRIGDGCPEGNATNPIPDGEQAIQGSGESMLQAYTINSKIGLFDKISTSDPPALPHTPPPPQGANGSPSESPGGSLKINSAFIAAALTSMKKSDVLQREVAKKFEVNLEDMLKCMKRCLGNIPKSMAVSYLTLQSNEGSKVTDEQKKDTASQGTNNDDSPEGKKPEASCVLPQNTGQNASSEDQLDSSDLAVLSATCKWLEDIKKGSSKSPKRSSSKPRLASGREGEGDLMDDSGFLEFHFFSDVERFVHPLTEQLFTEARTVNKDGSSDEVDNADHMVDLSKCECEVTTEILQSQRNLLKALFEKRKLVKRLLYQLTEDLPFHLRKRREQMKDSLEVESYLSNIREQKRMQRKEKRDKEIQDQNFAAKLAAATTSRSRRHDLDSDSTGTLKGEDSFGNTKLEKTPTSRKRDRMGSEVKSIKAADIRRTREPLYDSLATTCNTDAEALCAVCGNGDSPDHNKIVFCEHCEVPVHQVCYGVDDIPDGEWYCQPCSLFRKSQYQSRLDGQTQENHNNSRLIQSHGVVEEVRTSAEVRQVHEIVGSKYGGAFQTSCIFCPIQRGAFATLRDGRWAHVFCAQWLPGCTTTERHGRIVIEDITKIPKERWKAVCSICHNKWGACVECSHSGCHESFHPLCARRAGCYLQRFSDLQNGVSIAIPGQPGQTRRESKIFCEKHSQQHRVKATQKVRGSREQLDVLQIFRHRLEQLRHLCDRVVRRERLKHELTKICKEDDQFELKDLIRQHSLLNSKSQTNISSYFMSSSLTSHRRNRVQTERESTSVPSNMDSKEKRAKVAKSDEDAETSDTSSKGIKQQRTSRKTKPTKRKASDASSPAYGKLKRLMTENQAREANDSLPAGFKFVKDKSNNR